MSIAIIIECDITKHYFMLAILSKFLHVVSGALKVITRFYCKVRPSRLYFVKYWADPNTV